MLHDFMQTELVLITGEDGDQIPTYLARPLGPGPFPGMLISHHAPGWDEASKEIARTFARHGYIALLPNMHHRDLPGGDPDAAAAAARAAGNVPDARVIADMRGAVSYLETMPAYSGRKGIIGYSYGGRSAFVASCFVGFDATIVCYGGSMVIFPGPSKYATSPSPEPRRPYRAVDLIPQLNGPFLGLYGAEDTHPSPEDVKVVEAALIEHGKEHEIHIFPGAAHAFFGVVQQSYRPDVAAEGWARIWDFGDRYLQTKG